MHSHLELTLVGCLKTGFYPIQLNAQMCSNERPKAHNTAYESPWSLLHVEPKKQAQFGALAQSRRTESEDDSSNPIRGASEKDFLLIHTQSLRTNANT